MSKNDLYTFSADHSNVGPNTFDLDNYLLNNNSHAAVPNIRNSQKRSVEVFDDFCQDVKRKRIDPLYNEGNKEFIDYSSIY